MSNSPEQTETQPMGEGSSRRAPVTPTKIFLRGLAVTLPTILTIVILMWIARWVQSYIITPATWIVKYSISYGVDDSVASKSLFAIDVAPELPHCGNAYLVTEQLRRDYQNFLRTTQPRPTGSSEEFSSADQRRSEWMLLRAEELTPAKVYIPLGPEAVPYAVYAEVARSVPPGQVPTSARAVYMEYVAERYFQSALMLSALTVVLIIMVLYFVGRFVSVRLGGWIVHKVEEQVLGRLPVIRNVYGSVKQVTDFVFSDTQQVDYRRVVAVEYPRKGIWTIGFVTGESMLEIAIASGEPCVSVLIPTSPMPMTGFTISVPRSEVVDLNLTVEQAMQFCISCGVLTPSHQRLPQQMLDRLVKTGVLKNTSSRQVSESGKTSKLENQPSTGVNSGVAGG